MHRAATIVIGLGNPLMGDDGIGLELLARLQRDWSFVPDVIFLDGGTWGMNLLPAIEDAGQVLFLDAVNAGRDPGTPLRLERSAIPRWLSIKLSPHQIDLKEVLALAELRGTLPEQTVVVGVQPGSIDLRTSLSPEAVSGLDQAAELARSTLERWGHRARRERGVAVYA
ncbi:MAG TPA: HyaD/HybD family hydrogenase maturation endopeptidase [Gemmatimonadales bacterium]|nr:HyaD/HybD family hydrogenase maturation endopeptidase [Gemmatimonadales bacterium]